MDAQWIVLSPSSWRAAVAAAWSTTLLPQVRHEQQATCTWIPAVSTATQWPSCRCHAFLEDTNNSHTEMNASYWEKQQKFGGRQMLLPRGGFVPCMDSEVVVLLEQSVQRVVLCLPWFSWCLFQT